MRHNLRLRPTAQPASVFQSGVLAYFRCGRTSALAVRRQSRHVLHRLRFAMSRLLFALYAVVPPFAFFGPFFIVQSIPGLSGWRFIYASIGAFMTGLAILAVMLRQRKIDARLEALDGHEGQMDGSARKSAQLPEVV